MLRRHVGSGRACAVLPLLRDFRYAHKMVIARPEEKMPVFAGIIHLCRVEGQVDQESGFKEVWRAELLSRLALLDQVISEQAIRTASVRERGWDATVFEKRAELYQTTRRHYVALLEQLLVDGKLPMLWTELDADVPDD